MSLLNKEDDIIEDIIGDVVLVEIKNFLYNHLPRTVYMNCIENSYNYDHYGEFISVPITFCGTRIKFNLDGFYKDTYHGSSSIYCPTLHLEKVDGLYVINPNTVNWPIILQNIKLDHLPSYIKFYKNPEEEKPLQFIVRATGEDNWIYDLPKGSAVLLIESDLMNIPSRTDSNWFRGRYDFLVNPDFVKFMLDHGKTCII